MHDCQKSAAKRTLWISLLLIGLLILLSTSYNDNFLGGNREVIPQKLETTQIIVPPTNISNVTSPIVDLDENYNRLEIISNQPAEQASNVENPSFPKNHLRELFDGTSAPRFDPVPEIHDYDDLLLLTIVPAFTNSTNMETLRSLVGSIHMLRQGRNYVPKIKIFTPTLVRDIRLEIVEEISWWNRVTLHNIQEFLGLPLTKLFTDIDEHRLRLSILEQLVMEHGHAVWIKYGYVFEPQRVQIHKAEKAGSVLALTKAYSEGRAAMMNLITDLQTTGYLLLRQGSNPKYSNYQPVLPTRQDPSHDMIEAESTINTEEMVMEGYTRELGWELIKTQLNCHFHLHGCKPLPTLEVNDAENSGVFLIDPSSRSACLIEVKEESFKGTLLDNVIAETPLNDAIKAHITDPNVRKVAIALPTTSKGLEVSDMPVFLRVLIPSFLATVTNDEWPKFMFTIYVGYDHGDTFFESDTKRQEIIIKAMELFDNRPIQLKLLRLPNLRRVALLWNFLYLHALHDSTDYFYQVNDDLTMVTSGWLTYFVNTLEANDGFGVVGPADYFNALNCSILTQAMITPVHYEIFGSLYPIELKDWKTDRWLTYIYQPNHSHCRQDIIANNGAVATRYKHCEFLSYVIYVEAAKRRIAEWKAQKAVTKQDQISTDAAPQ